MSCKVEDCSLPDRTRGFCGKHYAKWSRNQLPEYEPNYPKKLGAYTPDIIDRLVMAGVTKSELKKYFETCKKEKRWPELKELLTVNREATNREATNREENVFG